MQDEARKDSGMNKSKCRKIARGFQYGMLDGDQIAGGETDKFTLVLKLRMSPGLMIGSAVCAFAVRFAWEEKGQAG
ncbi:hypothetical protein N7457_006256 [Penicillium paradoxum]|uniref:uncharacterized protein n=1 Tax=Penicillium paradoxum TaxID=176176 RepID=UPI002546B0B2|nr:uncharacterized protein N7457_006256 [Penicillium paradoxum]KAJ5781096.1 hypothetical protein N7457_006256 [Penicillium paradoxum]